VSHYLKHTVVGVDPGETTGVFVLSDEGEVTSYELMFLEAVNVVETIARERALERRKVLIAVERFWISDRTLKAGLETYWSIEITGCMRWVAMRYAFPFKRYSQADTMAFLHNDGLRKLGWWYRGGDGHANDAARVAGLALAATDPPRWKHLVLTSGLLREE
jgi:hypothetical protein